MRALLPPNVVTSSRAALTAYIEMNAPTASGSTSGEPAIVVSGALVARLWSRRALWFTRMPGVSIAQLHKVELNAAYDFTGMDICELRAVYYCLPAAFESDGDRAKEAYRTALRERLMALTEKEANGTLEPGERVHSAYTNTARLKAAVKAIVSLRKMRGALGSLGLKAAAGTSTTGAGAAEPEESFDDDGSESDDEGELSFAGRRVPFSTARFGASSFEIADANAVVACPLLADDGLQNAEAIRGNVAVIKRGACTFAQKHVCWPRSPRSPV